MGTKGYRDDLWHYVAGSWDGARLQLYVDDQLEAETRSTLTPGANTQPVCIGKRLSGWGGYIPFLGSSDDVRVFQ